MNDITFDSDELTTHEKFQMALDLAKKRPEDAMNLFGEISKENWRDYITGLSSRETDRSRDFETLIMNLDESQAKRFIEDLKKKNLLRGYSSSGFESGALIGIFNGYGKSKKTLDLSVLKDLCDMLLKRVSSNKDSSSFMSLRIGISGWASKDIDGLKETLGLIAPLTIPNNATVKRKEDLEGYKYWNYGDSSKLELSAEEVKREFVLNMAAGVETYSLPIEAAITSGLPERERSEILELLLEYGFRATSDGLALGALLLSKDEWNTLKKNNGKTSNILSSPRNSWGSGWESMMITAQTKGCDVKEALSRIDKLPKRKSDEKGQVEKPSWQDAVQGDWDERIPLVHEALMMGWGGLLDELGQGRSERKLEIWNSTLNLRKGHERKIQGGLSLRNRHDGLANPFIKGFKDDYVTSIGLAGCAALSGDPEMLRRAAKMCREKPEDLMAAGKAIGGEAGRLLTEGAELLAALRLKPERKLKERKPK